MDKAIILYIGSDNETLKISEEYENKAHAIISKYFEGYTKEEVAGYWQGQKEETMKITSFVEQIDKESVKKLCEELKQNLKQISIGVEFKKIQFNEF